MVSIGMSSTPDDTFRALCTEYECAETTVTRKLGGYDDYDSVSEREACLREVDGDLYDAQAAMTTIQRELRHWQYKLKSTATQTLKQMRAQHAAQTEALAERRRQLEAQKQQQQQQQELNSGDGGSNNTPQQRHGPSKAMRAATARQELLKKQHAKNERSDALDVRAALEKTDSSLSNTEYVLAETLESGADTSVTLREQRDIINRARDNVHEMDGVLVRSRMVLQRMKRRVVANKLIQAGMIVCELGIGALIVWYKYYR